MGSANQFTFSVQMAKSGLKACGSTQFTRHESTVTFVETDPC
jgi:hypothetical protein